MERIISTCCAALKVGLVFGSRSFENAPGGETPPNLKTTADEDVVMSRWELPSANKKSRGNFFPAISMIQSFENLQPRADALFKDDCKLLLKGISNSIAIPFQFYTFNQFST
jgi:hypothetical protein